MDDQVEDLWPTEFNTKLPDPEPARLLKQQASLLSKRTGGVVEGVVEENTIDKTDYYSLYLTAPALGEYMVKILYIALPTKRRLSNPFPLTVVDTSDDDKGQEVSDLDQFKSWLKDILNSNAVKAILGSMMSRSARTVSS